MKKNVSAHSGRCPFHHRNEVDIDTEATSPFTLLDVHCRLAGHIDKPSLMMAGAAMRVETDERLDQAVGSLIRRSGCLLGVTLGA